MEKNQVQTHFIETALISLFFDQYKLFLFYHPITNMHKPFNYFISDLTTKNKMIIRILKEHNTQYEHSNNKIIIIIILTTAFIHVVIFMQSSFVI